jgi:hypothetical protein
MTPLERALPAELSDEDRAWFVYWISHGGGSGHGSGEGSGGNRLIRLITACRAAGPLPEPYVVRQHIGTHVGASVYRLADALPVARYHAEHPDPIAAANDENEAEGWVS